MNGKELRRLAEIASIAKLDMTPEPFRLTACDGKTVAWYRGMYAAGGVEVAAWGGHGFDVHLNADQFASLTALFEPKAEVTLTPLDSSLRLSSGSRRLYVRYVPRSPLVADGQYEALREQPPYATVNRALLASRVAVAVTNVADSVAVPILTGVRIIFARLAGVAGILGLQTADGVSTIYQTRVPARVEGVLGEVVAAGRDLAAVMKLFDGAEVSLSLLHDGRGLVIVGEDAAIQIPLMEGKWPDLAAIRKERFTEEIPLPVETVKALVAAARIYYTRDGHAFSGNVTLTQAEDGSLVVETTAQETGQFSETVMPFPGIVVDEDGNEVIPPHLLHPYELAVSDLEKAARVATGETIVIEFGARLARVATDEGEVYMLLRSLR